MTGVTDCGPVRRRMLVNDLRAQRSVNGAGNSQPPAGQEHRQFGIRQLSGIESPPKRFTHSPFVVHTEREGGIHTAAGLLRHAEGTIDQTSSDVLGCRAESGDLVVVDRRGAVHRDMGDDPTFHEVDEERRKSGLDDVSAQHDDDCPSRPGRIGYRIDDSQKIPRDKYIGQGREKCSEASIRSRRSCEFARRHFVGTTSDRDSPDFREVGFGDAGRFAAGRAGDVIYPGAALARFLRFA